MRPDKQKQKYKKKMGYGPGSKTGVEGADGKGSANEARKDRRDRKPPQPEVSPSATTNSRDSSDSCEEEETTSFQPRKQFRRRQIESNWTRYEEGPVEEDDKLDQEVKVAEFQRLLAANVSVDAHLVLDDEREWQTSVDVGGDVATADDVTGAEYLSLDCDSLAASMQQIPLYERLDVRAIVEQAGLVHHFNELVSGSGQNAGHGSRDDRRQEAKFSFRTPSKPTAEHIKALSDSLVNTLIFTAKNDDSETNDADVTEQNETKSESNDVVVESEPVEEFNWDTNEEVTLDWDNVPEDDDVVEADVENDESTKQEPEAVETVSKVTEEDEELDFLLSLDKPVQNNAQKPAPEVKKASVNTAAGPESGGNDDENLEAWLDSIL